VSDAAADDVWDAAGERFVDGFYGSLRGRVRTHLVHEHLRAHLAPPPLEIVDVGGGAGHQSLPLARDGYDVTIVDPSPSMLERARERLADEEEEVRRRVHLVAAAGEDAVGALDDRRFGGVLCHGVLPYLDDPGPLLDALCTLAAPGGVVSVLAKNVDALAVRPAVEGDWAAALAAFDARRDVNALGLDTRGDRVDDLSDELASRGVDPVAWYGVRLFTDLVPGDGPVTGPEELVLAVELEASRRDPYRALSRLLHLVGRRRA
jgi:S-adenosylmethionine-dependent methyltransferase